MSIETSDITDALRASGIDYGVEHPGTCNESVHVVRGDGRTVAFGPAPRLRPGGGALGVGAPFVLASPNHV